MKVQTPLRENLHIVLEKLEDGMVGGNAILCHAMYTARTNKDNEIIHIINI